MRGRGGVSPTCEGVGEVGGKRKEKKGKERKKEKEK